MSLRACQSCASIFRESFIRCPMDGAELEELMDDPLVGRVLDERYLVVEAVGNGAMGRVYRVEHVRTGRSFAAKVMFGDLAADPSLRERFRRETEAASRLDHPNVVAALDLGETPGGVPYYTMDFLEGRTLTDRVREEGPLDEPAVRKIACAVAAGLEHAHSRQLVHRDLKPDNIYLARVGGPPSAAGSSEEVVKVVDFGIAYLADLDSQDRLTKKGHIVGTPSFMAPEQIAGGPVDGRADIFALGMCIHYAMMGRAPFLGTPAEVLQKIAHQPVPSLRWQLPEGALSAELARVVARMCARDPGARFSSARELLEALRASDPHAASGYEIEAPASSGGATPFSSRGSSGRAVKWAAVVALLGGGLAYSASRGLLPDVFPFGNRVTATPIEVVDDEPLEEAPRLEEASFSEAEPPVLRAQSPSPRGAERPRERGTSADRPEPRASRRPSGRDVASEARSTKDAPARPGPAPEVPEAEERESFQSMYERTGERLQAFIDERGEEAAKALRDRYFAIDYTAALTNASVRARARRELERLRADVEAAREP